MPKVVVVGAGVVGLSTAIHIQKQRPSTQVTVVADKFEKQTTSHGAGGLFRPNLEHLLGVDPDTVTRWSHEGFNFYSKLAVSPEAAETGHMVMPGYVFSNTEIKNPLYKSVVFSFRQLSSEELEKLAVKYKFGYQVTTVITDCSRFMPWLMRKFKEQGGVVENKHVDNLEEFVGKYDVVVNCSGIHSRELVGDRSVYPIRGHLIRLKAPWIKYWVYTEDSAYFIPGYDSLAIGGVRQKDNYNLEIDPKDTAGILERCYKLWPSLQGAPVLSEWVDLRPHRDPLRLEKETMKFPKGSLNVVHNYGHGALGITLAWGTGKEASQLAVQCLSSSTSKL
ncbi:D-aspartate oxidase-like isoform X2 [Ruditapes philippinarum]|nr:D-aspartate oxidase-like isoform X2 [Ruditapes philippinarum]XP_060563959.1 D-aspartate oxidase-like isoform X2 [Ruditapes philippinarum]